MSIWSTFIIGFSFFGSFLFCLNASLPKPDSEVAPASSALNSPLREDKEVTPSPVDSAADLQPNATDAFTSFRAALATAKLRARELTSYTAILEMQEEVNGSLREMETIEIKLRRQPFSVYMRWTDNGQEALFVRGMNDDRVLVKPANGLASLKRLWRLDPDSRMAKQSCRYPITDSGIENLVNRVDAFYAAREDWSSVVNCSVSKSTQADKVVTEYCLQFRDKTVSPDYLKSQLTFDVTTGLLLVVQNFGWADAESPQIVEYYAYRAIDSSSRLSDSDFDEKNSDYGFVAR